MIPYWQTMPIRMPLGLRKAMRKSLKVSDAPMPSMMSIIMTPSSRVSSSLSMVDVLRRGAQAAGLSWAWVCRW